MTRSDSARLAGVQYANERFTRRAKTSAQNAKKWRDKMQNEINDTDLVPMLVCTQPPVISENLMDLQERVNSITEMIIQLPKEPESVPQVKKTRADLRK